MPRVKKLDLGMTALDELFMNDKERAENKLPKIFDIPLSEIDDFPDHPYRVLDDEDMQNLMESIVYFSAVNDLRIHFYILAVKSLRYIPTERYKIFVPCGDDNSLSFRVNLIACR